MTVHFRVTFRNLMGSLVLGKGHVRYPVINMANEEQLELIKQGVDPWNRWKRQHADKADLSGVDLRGTNLSLAELHQADLNTTNLSGVNFSKAYLYGADLKKELNPRMLAVTRRWISCRS